MEKPKCKLCGDRHWSREPCKAIATSEAAKRVAASVSIAPPIVQRPAVAADPAPTALFDKRAYQREYMRQRRAAAKRKAAE